MEARGASLVPERTIIFMACVILPPFEGNQTHGQWVTVLLRDVECAFLSRNVSVSDKDEGYTIIVSREAIRVINSYEQCQKCFHTA